MTALTLSRCDVVKHFDDDGPLTVKSGEDISNRRGKYLRVDATNGKAMLGNATSTGELGNLNGVAVSNQKHTGDSVTLLRHGLMDWGTALDAMDYGAPIYVSDTDGVFADSAGSTSKVAGRVFPVFEDNGDVKKLALIDLR